MSLRDLIAGVEGHEKTLTVFNADESVVTEIREYFSDRNVSVESEETPSGKPGKFVTLSDGDEVLTAAGFSDLRQMFEGDGVTLGIRERPYQPILDHLDETMFTSWSVDQMVAASREIEDRAYRVGSGTLRAGFQYISTLENEVPVYERLGSTDVNVHAYAFPDTDSPDNDEFALHMVRADEIRETWFVVFDGGPDPENKCALLAEERDSRTFYGFWTYDESTIDWILDYLESTY